jgi:hypothetical protein
MGRRSGMTKIFSRVRPAADAILAVIRDCCGDRDSRRSRESLRVVGVLGGSALWEFAFDFAQPF